MSLQPHHMRIEEAMPTDEDPSMYNSNNNPYNNRPSQSQSSYPPYIPQQQQQPQGMDYHMQQPAPPMQDEEEESRIRERTEARERAQAAQAAAKGGAGQPMRIRNDYVPRAQARRQNMAMAICPNCNQQIPHDEIEQHMRSKSIPNFFLFAPLSLLHYLNPVLTLYP